MEFRKLWLVAFVLITSICSLSAQDWKTNIEEAKALAKEEQKLILLSFQGSDWCAPCIKLEKKIWHSPEFNVYAKENLVLLKADFPKRKKNRLSKEQEKHNQQLAEQYNRQGVFPLVLLLDEKGTVVGQTGYKKVSPTVYVEELKALSK